MMIRNILDLFRPFIKIIRHKIIQTKRLSKQTAVFALIMMGATLVSLTALGFSKLVNIAIELNHQWVSHFSKFAFLVIPLGFMLITWLTKRYAPYTAGSGIPQVIASIYETHSFKKNILVSFWPTILKIPLTFIGLLLGASIGREGPTVQVGASVMLLWGKTCEKFKLTRIRFKYNELLTMGAAGGMAAAFNAPLAGVIFAIEELSRITYLRWERMILFGILASGFILIAIEGNNPHFPPFASKVRLDNIFIWIIFCAFVCGILGGIFSKLLLKGFLNFLPQKIRKFFSKYPLFIAGFMGLCVAAIGFYYHGKTYGIGYQLSSNALTGQAVYIPGLMEGKYFATVFSYWAGLPGGIFTPSLSIGATIGITLQSVFSLSGISVDIIVLLCMAAFLAALTQAPLTASVVVMEMTLSISMLFWLLICCIIASFVARQFCPRPFYLASAIKYVSFLNLIEPDTKKQNKL